MLDHTYWKEAEKQAAAPQVETRLRRCDHPDCAEEGIHRAPKSRRAISGKPSTPADYHFFCLPHVQEYNKAWNYYAGLNETQMDEVRRQDMLGWQPTWPLGQLGAGGRHIPDELPTVDALKAKIWQEFFGGKGPKARRAQQAAAHSAAC